MIWALDDFDEANGATVVVPQSNSWPRSSFTNRPPTQISDCAKSNLHTDLCGSELQLTVRMPKGSALIFTGSTLPGGGENRTDSARRSVLIGYQLGWLRPEHK